MGDNPMSDKPHKIFKGSVLAKRAFLNWLHRKWRQFDESVARARKNDGPVQGGIRANQSPLTRMVRSAALQAKKKARLGNKTAYYEPMDTSEDFGLFKIGRAHV